MRIFKFKNNGGFTLVETMVAIAISLILSTMLLSYNRSSEKQIVLFREQAVLVGFLNRAKSLAVEKFNQNTQACAFGVYFPGGGSKEFILFQDLEPKEKEPIFGCNKAGANDLNYNEGEKLESFTMDERLKFADTLPPGLTILFIPPELDVSSNAELPVTIKIETLQGESSALIKVGKFGQITAE